MYNLFIVDDEQTVIDGLSNCIQWQDHNISVCGFASDGNTAYDSILKQKPDIVITDIRMPGMTGLDLIDKVNLVYNDIKFIVFSGYSEFEHAKHALRSNAVDYLVKPVAIEELVKSVTKAIELKERDQFHIKLVEDSVLQNNEIQEKMYYDAILQNKPLDFLKCAEDKKYILVVFRIKNTSELNEHFAQKYLQIRGEIKLGDSIGYHLLKMPGEYVAIINCKEEDSDLLPLIAKDQIIDNRDWFSTDSVGEVYFGISNLASMSNILSAYQEALAAMSYSEYLSIPVTHYKEVKYREVDLNISQWTQVIDMQISRCNYDAISTILDQIFKYCRDMHVSPIIVKKLDLDLVYHSIEKSEHDLKLSAKEIWAESDNFIKEVEKLVSLEDSKNYLNNFYRKIIEFLSRKSIGLKARTINKLKDYIKNNLSKPITLDELALVVRKSPGYVSMVFKNETGSTITQYITDRKILHAKELLTKSDFKIAEIAHAIGFSEERYFYQIFKKETGLTAGDYRKLHQLDSPDTP